MFFESANCEESPVSKDTRRKCYKISDDVTDEDREEGEITGEESYSDDDDEIMDMGEEEKAEEGHSKQFTTRDTQKVTQVHEEQDEIHIDPAWLPKSQHDDATLTDKELCWYSVLLH